MVGVCLQSSCIAAERGHLDDVIMSDATRRRVICAE
jgi:hypothetical protein